MIFGGKDSAVSRGHRRELTVLLPHPAPLCALKPLSKELLSIRSRHPHRFRAKTPVCLQKHINLLQPGMKGSSCPPKQDRGHVPAGLAFPNVYGVKCACSILQPLTHHRPALQAPAFKGEGIKTPISSISFWSFFFFFFPFSTEGVQFPVTACTDTEKKISRNCCSLWEIHHRDPES